MKPPKQASTCMGNPFSLAISAISSIGSMTPWGHWGAEAATRIVSLFISCNKKYAQEPIILKYFQTGTTIVSEKPLHRFLTEADLGGKLSAKGEGS